MSLVLCVSSMSAIEVFPRTNPKKMTVLGDNLLCVKRAQLSHLCYPTQDMRNRGSIRYFAHIEKSLSNIVQIKLISTE